MKITVNLHQYAPELSRVFLNGIEAPFRLCSLDVAKLAGKSAGEVVAYIRGKFLKPAAGIGKLWKMSSQYPAQWADLNRTHSGRATTAEALAALKRFKSRTAGGPLLDGRTLPAAKILISVRPALRFYSK